MENTIALKRVKKVFISVKVKRRGDIERSGSENEQISKLMQ